MPLGLTARQISICRGAIHEAKRRYGSVPGGARKAADIVVMAMFPESGCRVLANRNVPISKNYPHDLLPWSYDGLGGDHASCGTLQQQTGTEFTPAGYGYAMNQTTMNSPLGWGHPKDLMTPSYAAGRFFDKMEQRYPDNSWLRTPGHIVCQDVQGSAYDGYPRESNNYSSIKGGNYLAQRGRAISVVRLLLGTVTVAKPPKVVHPKPHPKPKPKPPTKKVYRRVRSGQYLGIIASNWRTNVDQLVEWNRKAHPSLVTRPDYVAVGWKLRVR